MAAPASRPVSDGHCDRVSRLFEAKARTWPAKYAAGGRLAGRLDSLTATLRAFLPAGGRLLDLGCGTGELARAAAAGGARVTGCDIAARMLGVAAELDPGGAVEWVRLDPGWQALPFPARSFDVVVASSVLEYVADPAAVLRECGRVVRPGGFVVCTVPAVGHPARWLEALARPLAGAVCVAAAGRRWPRLDGYLAYLRLSRHRHSAGWWRRTAGQAGFEPVRATSRAGVGARCSGPSSLRLLALTRIGSGSGSGSAAG